MKAFYVLQLRVECYPDNFVSENYLKTLVEEALILVMELGILIFADMQIGH